MKTEEITVGEFYEAKVNGRLVNVRVQKVCDGGIIRVLRATNRTAYINAGKFTRGPLKITDLTKPTAKDEAGKAAIVAARKQYQIDGFVEIDDDAVTVSDKSGTWVRAYVFVKGTD